MATSNQRTDITPPEACGTSLQNDVHNQTIALKTTQKDSHASVLTKDVLEPRIGMEFDDDEKAYQFYNGYARQVGFSVRKQNMSRAKNGIIRARRFVCSKEGYYKLDPSDKTSTCSRSDVRTGCHAHIGIKRLKNGRYCIHRFVPEHNHPLVSSRKVHLLRSQREYPNARKPSSEDVFSACTSSSCTSHFQGLRQFEMQQGDAVGMVHYLQKRAAKELGFSFSMQLDAKDQITNLFWCDARSRIDYYYFGDVVCFDNTYKVNGYDRPFVSFLGTNHHKQLVIFGSGFLYNDSVESFNWLFQTFKDSMSGNAPHLILTDEDENIVKGVEEIWPDTVHRYCPWHLYQRTVKNLCNVFQAYPGFDIELKKCFFECETENEFLVTWQKLVSNYGLVDDTWLKGLYENRRNWCLVYRHDLFHADLHNTLKNERMHALIKSGLHHERDIFSFFKRYERILKDKRYSEIEADYGAAHLANPMPLSRLLKQAALAYTRPVYEMVAKEFELYVDCVIDNCGADGTGYVYEVTNVEKKITGYVRYEPCTDALSCSCKKYEFVGVLCSHVLKVLDYKNTKEIPEKYVLRRWKKDAKSRVNMELYDDSDEIDPTTAIENRYASLGRVFEQVMAKGSACQEAYTLAMEEADKILEKLQDATVNRVRNEYGSSLSEGEKTIVERVRVCKKRRKKHNGADEGIAIKKSRKEKLGGTEAKSAKGKEGNADDHTARLEPHLEDSASNFNPWSSVGYLSLQFPTLNQEAFVPGSTQQPFCITTGQSNQNGSSPFIMNSHPQVTGTFPSELSDRQVT
ncbi:Protein FAR1-RELATED SEQUENCE 5 [Rhynchospora pubera]|uniref:Protein FAR1-RELATED SEQUENCE n=1 Tax=Rhynchospora pubera TaxID=906938 RepID=A0AAV8CGP6_9POAL|nr:Protein FAR1-RELATED SEQUENCE 5 [Rhynchospora pubera]